MKKTLISIISSSVSGKSNFGGYLQSKIPGVQYLNWTDFKLKSNGKSNPTEQEAIDALFTQASKHDVLILDNASLSSGMKNIYDHFGNKVIILDDNVTNRDVHKCVNAAKGMKANLYQSYKGNYYSPQTRYRAEKLAALKPTFTRVTWLMSNECLERDIQSMLRSFNK